MFADKRVFRALVFSSKADATQQILDAYPSEELSDATTLLENSDERFSIEHGYYYSEIAYAPVDSLVDARVGSRYKYDFYICKWRHKRKNIFILAVPFSKMARDFFQPIEESSSALRTKYQETHLELLTKSLASSSAISKLITATSISFLVTGGDKVKSAVLSGTDVVNSEYFKRASKFIHGLRLVPRRVKIKYDDYPDRFSIEFDGHGSYWFRVSKDAANLATLQSVLNILSESNVLTETVSYPLRAGLTREGDDE